MQLENAATFRVSQRHFWEAGSKKSVNVTPQRNALNATRSGAPPRP